MDWKTDLPPMRNIKLVRRRSSPDLTLRPKNFSFSSSSATFSSFSLRYADRTPEQQRTMLKRLSAPLRSLKAPAYQTFWNRLIMVSTWGWDSLPTMVLPHTL